MNSVVIYSWPYQWLYWPAYAALSNIEESHGYSFSLASGFQTDSKIKEAMEARAREPGIRIALSEPPAEGEIEQVPVLWRLPHWFYWNELYSAGEAKQVKCFPKGSTSGNYVRDVLSDSHDFLDLGPTLHDIETLETDKTPVFSITPLHSLRKAIPHEAYAGPLQKVTSFWTYRGDDASDLMLHLRTTQKDVIGRLYRLADQHDELKHYIDNRAAEQFGRPRSLTSEMLAYFLQEYLQRAAYFPYDLIDRAVGDEVEAIVKDEGKGLAKAVRESFRLSWGTERRWEHLCFSDRMNVHEGGQFSLRGGGETGQGSLKQFLTHKHENWKTQDEWSKGLGRINLKIGDGRLPFLSLKVPEDVLVCTPVMTGSLEEGRACGETPCFVCSAIGRAASFARMLESRIECEFERSEWKGYGVTSKVVAKQPGSTCVVICRSDVSRLADIFLESTRTPCSARPTANCSVYIVPAKESDPWLLAITWNGCTREMTSSRSPYSTEEKLKEWATGCRAAGRPASISFAVEPTACPCTRRTDTDELSSLTPTLLSSPAREDDQEIVNKLWRKVPVRQCRVAYCAVFHPTLGNAR